MQLCCLTSFCWTCSCLICLGEGLAGSTGRQGRQHWQGRAGSRPVCACLHARCVLLGLRFDYPNKPHRGPPWQGVHVCGCH